MLCLGGRTLDVLVLLLLASDPLFCFSSLDFCRHSLLHQREGENRTATLAREVCAELLQPRVYDGLLR